MSEHDARDPFVGLTQHIRKEARGQYTPAYAIGKVISVKPLVIRADGMDLDKDDLLIPAHLTAKDWPVVSTLPARTLSGSYNPLTGEVHVYRPEEKLTGVPFWAEKEKVDTPKLEWFKVGETVLLIRAEDGQTYCVVERMVRPDEPVSTD